MNHDREATRLSRRACLLGAAAGLVVPRPARASVTVSEVLVEVEAASAALRSAAIDGHEWRRRVTGVLAGVDARALRAAIELDWSEVRVKTRTKGRYERRLERGELRGTPADAHVRRKLYCLGRDHAILPHAHRHIASVFVVLDGRAHARHFDRLGDEPDAILIRASDDRLLAPGDFAAITDEADNVHWFAARDDQALLLNFSVTVPPSFRIHAGEPGRIYLDPDGEPLADEVIRAPRVGRSQLRAKYDGTGL